MDEGSREGKGKADYKGSSVWSVKDWQELWSFREIKKENHI